MSKADIFNVELSDLINLRKWYKRAPKEFLRGTASMLNDLAFGTRGRSAIEIEKTMVIRNLRFVMSSLRVVKANARKALDYQKAEVGSISRDRFTGWQEQEFGTTARKSRTHSLLSRGGTEGGIVRRRARLLSGSDFPTPNDYPGKSKAHRAVVMIIMLKRKRYRKPFVISGLESGYRNFPQVDDGLYQYTNKDQFRALQKFKDKPIKPRRVRWMSRAREAFLSSVNITQLWTKNIKYILKNFRR